MPEKFVIFNGLEVIEGWPEKMAEAQFLTTYRIGGEEYQRIRYGEEVEDWGADRHPCRDCAAIKGQYHAPFLCDVENCPCCGGQMLSCDCSYEGDGEE